LNEQGWTRDKTPYLVFPCIKCHQFSYVKLTQKTKKCLRCGRTHQVNSIISTGEKVYGITNALELVKKRQVELMGDPQFKADNSFKIILKQENRLNEQEHSDQKDSHKHILVPVKHTVGKEEDYTLQFKGMLLKLAKMYKSFPKYLIDIMAENFSIPKQQVTALLRNMIRQGFLSYSKEKKHYLLSN